MAANKLSVIVMGAAGRMGNLIATLVNSNPAFTLAGVTDHSSKIGELDKFKCPVADKLDSLVNAGFSGVIIDFTAPEVSLNTARIAARAGVCAVIGTTGLNDEQQAELWQLAQQTPILWSANMSIGINVLEKLLPELARNLGPQYDMELVEIHHKHKKDSPSGTAIMLAKSMASARSWNLDETRVSCRDGIIGARKEKEIGVMAVRGGDVVGIHTAYFLGPGEIIEVKHQAESRENFAQGALRAAQWLSAQKPGKLYSIQDMIRN